MMVFNGSSGQAQVARGVSGRAAPESIGRRAYREAVERVIDAVRRVLAAALPGDLEARRVDEPAPGEARRA
ncbi:MAG: hypothetical protein H6828_08045 [Planctomycetes bacterium]|nr:hypothetical protein [Planctomycetota bacterium]